MSSVATNGKTVSKGLITRPGGPFLKRPGARFSKDPITYRARKAIYNDLYLRN